MRRRVSPWVVCLILFANVAAAADQDVEKSLIGSWLVTVEGEARTRTLDIRRLIPAENGRIAMEAAYGWTGEKPSAASQPRVIRDGGRVLVEFTTVAKSEVRTELGPDGTLSGTIAYKSGDVRSVNLVRTDATSRKATQPAVAKDTRILVLYVGAHNCPGCREWETAIGSGFRRDFLTSEEIKFVEYREVKTQMYSDTAVDKDWPDDLKWVRDKTNVKRGTPRFIVAVDNKVTLNAFGRRGWTSEVVPLVKTLVGQKKQASGA